MKKITKLLSLIILLIVINKVTVAQWSVDSLSMGRANLVGVSNKKAAVFYGGLNSNINISPPSNHYDIYDVATHTWKSGTTGTGRWDMAGTSFGPRIYIAGGYEGYYHGGLTNKLIVYNTDIGDWEYVPASARLSGPRRKLAAAAAGSKVMFAGGMFHTNNIEIGVDSVDVYDTLTATPQDPLGTHTVEHLSIGRHELCGASSGNIILFAGGRTGGTSGPVSKRVDLYNVCTGTWSIDSLSQARSLSVAVTSGSKIYIAGGVTDGFIASKVIDIYDVETKVWTVDSLSIPRRYLTGAATDNFVMFAGGSKGSVVYDTVDLLNVATNTWVRSELDTLRMWTAAVAIDDKFLVAGGSPKDVGMLKSIDVYQLPAANTAVPTGVTVSPLSCSGKSATVNWTSSLTSNTVRYRKIGDCDWKNTSATGNTVMLTGLTPATNYETQVRSNDPTSGISDYSGSTNFTTLDLGVAVPSGLAVSNITLIAADLNWNPTLRASSYTLQYKIDTASTWTTVPNIQTNSYSLGGLTQCNNYQVAVSAVNSCESSDYGTTVDFFIGQTVTTPSGLAVSNFIATTGNITAATIDLDWDLTPNASSYTVQYKIDTASSTWITVPNIPTNSYTISGLTEGYNYQVAVKANNICGSSPYCTAAGFLTSGLGIDQLNKGLQFSIFPNPATDMITLISSEINSKGEIKILNNLGQVVYNRVLPPNTTSFNINIEHLSNGFYTICYLNDKANSMKKFIKK